MINAILSSFLIMFVTLQHITLNQNDNMIVNATNIINPALRCDALTEYQLLKVSWDFPNKWKYICKNKKKVHTESVKHAAEFIQAKPVHTAIDVYNLLQIAAFEYNVLPTFMDEQLDVVADYVSSTQKHQQNKKTTDTAVDNSSSLLKVVYATHVYPTARVLNTIFTQTTNTTTHTLQKEQKEEQKEEDQDDEIVILL